MGKCIHSDDGICWSCQQNHARIEELGRLNKRIKELEENDRVFRKVIDKLTTDNGGTIPGWLLDLAP